MSNFKTITDFTPDKFTATKWDSPGKKAAFARQFIKFVQSDFARAKFPTRKVVHYDVGTSMFERVGILAFMDTDDSWMIEFSQQPCLTKYLGHVAIHRRIMEGLDDHFFIKIEVLRVL